MIVYSVEIRTPARSGGLYSASDMHERQADAENHGFGFDARPVDVDAHLWFAHVNGSDTATDELYAQHWDRDF